MSDLVYAFFFIALAIFFVVLPVLLEPLCLMRALRSGRIQFWIATYVYGSILAYVIAFASTAFCPFYLIDFLSGKPSTLNPIFVCGISVLFGLLLSGDTILRRTRVLKEIIHEVLEI